MQSKPTALPVGAGGVFLRTADDFDTYLSLLYSLSSVFTAPDLFSIRYNNSTMTDDSDNGRGRPREYGKEDVLTVLRELDDGSCARTGEVAEKVGCSTRTALRRLSSLEKDGKVESVEVTERMKLWSIVEE